MKPGDRRGQRAQRAQRLAREAAQAAGEHLAVARNRRAGLRRGRLGVQHAPARLRVQQHGHDLVARDPVDDRVVDLGQQCDAPALEAVDHVELPQRPPAVERAPEHAAAPSPRAAGRRPARERGLADVEVEIEVRIVDPVRAGRVPSGTCTSRQRNGGSRCSRSSSSCWISGRAELAARRGRRVVDAQERHVAVDPGGLDVEELGVEACSAAASNDPNSGRCTKKEAMRIAIVGAGISGLATAHLLHRAMRSPCSRPGARRAGTRTPSAWTPRTPRITWTPASSSSTIGTIPTSSGCWLRCASPSQPSDMSFGVSDGGDFEYNGSSPNGLFAKRAHLVTPWFHRMVADLVRFNRNARHAAGQRRRRARRSGTGSTRAATRGAFVERLIVPQASAVWSADPRQMWTFPARFLVEFFANHGMLGFAKRPQWRTIAGGSRTYVDAITKPFADRLRLDTPVPAIDARRGRRHGHAARRRAGALRRGRAGHPLRPGAADARRRHRPRARDPRRDPVPAQRGGPAHRPQPAAAPPARVGELELPPAAGADRDDARSPTT